MKNLKNNGCDGGRLQHKLLGAWLLDGAVESFAEKWNADDDGGEVRFWLGLMERRRLYFEKANLQAYIDLAGEAMEEMIHGRSEAGGDDPLQLLFCEG